MGKIDRIKISAEFHVAGNGMWLSAECPVTPEEKEIEEFKKVRDVLLESFRGLNPTLQINPEYVHFMSSGTEVIDPVVDQEITAQFESIKNRMMGAKTHSEANEIFKASGFPFNVELKQILNDKL